LTKVQKGVFKIVFFCKINLPYFPSETNKKIICFRHYQLVHWCNLQPCSASIITYYLSITVFCFLSFEVCISFSVFRVFVLNSTIVWARLSSCSTIKIIWWHIFSKIFQVKVLKNWLSIQITVFPFQSNFFYFAYFWNKCFTFVVECCFSQAFRHYWPIDTAEAALCDHY
jgi:hypothetical protein